MNETNLRCEMRKWLAGYFSWLDKTTEEEVTIAEDGWHAGFSAAIRLIKNGDIDIKDC